VVNRVHVDYAALLWWDFLNCVLQKKDVIQYPRNVTVLRMLILDEFITNDISKVQEKLAKEEIEKMVEGEEDDESYASEFADSMLNDDDDSSTRIEPGSHKQHLENVDYDYDETEKEK
ncbi:hypothetical protein Tco_1399426, partial [Tanacetum coccineum]